MNYYKSKMEFKVPKNWQNYLKFGEIRKSDDALGNYFEFDFFDIPHNLIEIMYKENHINILEYKILDFIINLNINYFSDYLNENLTKQQMLEHFKVIQSSMPSEIEIEFFDREFCFEHESGNLLTIFNPFGDESVRFKSFYDLFNIVEKRLNAIIKKLDPQLVLDDKYFKILDNKIICYNGNIKDLIYFIYKADIKKSYYKNLIDSDFYDSIISKIRNDKGKIIPISTVKKYYQNMKSDEYIEPSVENKEIIIENLHKIFCY